MTALRSKGFKWKYVPPADDAFATEATYERDGSFPCAFRSALAYENVRAGRDAQDRTLRVWFESTRIRFTLSDRIELNGELYDIVYIPDHSYSAGRVYVDVKAREVIES
jgi:hypothetical protein